MKRIGLVLLVVGFSWLFYDAVCGFNSNQHVRWVQQSQNLTMGDSIPRDEAIAAMRQLGLDLKDYHRIILLPGFCMLAGGLLIFFGRAGGRRNQVEYI